MPTFDELFATPAVLAVPTIADDEETKISGAADDGRGDKCG